LTPGQRHDSTQAEALLDGLPFAKVMADRGYAGAPFIAYLQARGCEAVIPPHQRATNKRVRYLALSRTPSGRVLHQQTQALSPHFLAL
jgi:transposase